MDRTPQSPPRSRSHPQHYPQHRSISISIAHFFRKNPDWRSWLHTRMRYSFCSNLGPDRGRLGQGTRALPFEDNQTRAKGHVVAYEGEGAANMAHRTGKHGSSYWGSVGQWRGSKQGTDSGGVILDSEGQHMAASAHRWDQAASDSIRQHPTSSDSICHHVRQMLSDADQGYFRAAQASSVSTTPLSMCSCECRMVSAGVG